MSRSNQQKLTLIILGVVVAAFVIAVAIISLALTDKDTIADAVAIKNAAQECLDSTHNGQYLNYFDFINSGPYIRKFSCANKYRAGVGIHIIDSTGEQYTIKYWNHGPFMSVTAYGEGGKLIYHYRDFSIGLLQTNLRMACAEAEEYKKITGRYPRFDLLKDLVKNKIQAPLYQALEDDDSTGTPGSILYYTCSLPCGSKMHIVAIGENGNTIQAVDK